MFMDMPREGWKKVISVLKEKEDDLKEKTREACGTTLSDDQIEEWQKYLVEFITIAMIRQQIEARIYPNKEKSK